MFHVVVCDDEKIFREELTAWLQRYQEENQVSFCIKEFHEGKELADHMPSQMDILFLDIKMKTMDGIKVAETVRALNEGVSIIFLTAVAEYALEGYKVNAFDYLIKPVSYEKLTKVLAKNPKDDRPKKHQVSDCQESRHMVQGCPGRYRFCGDIKPPLCYSYCVRILCFYKENERSGKGTAGRQFFQMQFRLYREF